jgi:hypothetical protein
MKKLLLEAGFPQILADYPLIAENNIKHALLALLAPLDNCIVSGCALSIAAGNWTIAAGWVIFEDELMRVEEHTINAVGGGDVIIAQKYEILVQNNPKPYLDGSTRPLIKEVMCRFVKRTAENPYVRYLVDMVPYSTRLAGIALPENNTWHQLASGKFTLATGVYLEATNPLQLSKSRDGQLRFKGALNFDMLAVNVSSGWRNILTINDATMRPADEVNFLIASGVDGSSNSEGFGYFFQLLPTGVLRLRHLSVAFDIGPVNFASVSLNIF